MKFKVTFEAKQTASITVVAKDWHEAHALAVEEWRDTGLEGKWKQGEPKVTTYKPMFDKSSVASDKWNACLEKLSGKNREMLQTLIESKRLTKSQLGFKIGMNHNSGTFAAYLGKLRSLGLLGKDGDFLVIKEK